MGQDSLAADGTFPVALAVHASRHIRRDKIAAVSQLPRRRDRLLRRNCLRFKANQHARDYVSWLVISRSSAQGHRPRFTIPGVNRAAGIDAGLLLDHAREAVVFRNELVPARELDANRTVDGLREQRGIERNRVRGVQAVAAGTTNKDYPHAVEWQTSNSRDPVLRGIDRLGGRPEGGMIYLHIGHGAR